MGRTCGGPHEIELTPPIGVEAPLIDGQKIRLVVKVGLETHPSNIGEYFVREVNEGHAYLASAQRAERPRDPGGVAAFTSAHSKTPYITPSKEFSSGGEVVQGRRVQQLTFALGFATSTAGTYRPWGVRAPRLTQPRELETIYPLTGSLLSSPRGGLPRWHR